MSRLLAALLVLNAMLMSSTTGLGTRASAICSVEASPCDNQWHSGPNQTFAFLGIAAPNLVQLYSYWGASKGCLNASSSTSASLPLSWATCSTPQSIWRYGPGSIQTFVYYNNSQGECLALRPNPSHPTLPSLGVAPCCHSAGQNCTAVESSMQMWLEPPTSKNPYSRIMSQYSIAGVPFCLTRVGNDC